MLVPVLDSNNQPLMPCHSKRARELMKRGEAKAYWQKGFFCIKLLKEPSVLKYYYVGGSSKGKISIHNENNERISRNIKVKNVKIISKNSWSINEQR